MSALDDHLKRHRRRIIEREERTFREILAAYDEIERELRRAYRDLQKKILEAKAAGDEISPSWLYRERRLRQLLEQVEEQVARFGGRISPIIIREQRAAIGLAVDQVNGTVRIVAGDTSGIGTLLNPRGVEDAVGMVGRGSPLNQYFAETLAPAVAEKIKAEVIKAVALGTDFNTIARRLVDAGGITRSRALSMARTEVNRIRRETTRQIYEENSDVISGWEWVASHSSRTCPVCLAMDGRVFKLEEPFPQHPNCRCDIIPVIIGFKRPERILGPDWFENSAEEIQTQIIGRDALDAYKKGDVKLKDFVGWKTDKRFGKSVYRKPLAKVLADQHP
jgi:SPP1 gp7 family putative phage head morphogenesis protein